MAARLSAAQIAVLALVPSVGFTLAMVSNCWLYSLYSFEYTWINAGWTLDQRLEYFETHWAYFLGFGSPFALIIWLCGLSPVVKSGACALLDCSCAQCGNVCSVLPVVHRHGCGGGPRCQACAALTSAALMPRSTPVLGLLPARIHMTARVRDITYHLLRHIRPASAPAAADAANERR